MVAFAHILRRTVLPTVRPEETQEDAEHVFFGCSHFEAKRETLQSELEEIHAPENLVRHIIQS